MAAIKKDVIYKVMFKDYPDVVNAAQMCEMLGGISTKTGYRLLKEGTIKSLTLGRQYRIPKLYIFEYLEIMGRETVSGWFAYLRRDILCGTMLVS